MAAKVHAQNTTPVYEMTLTEYARMPNPPAHEANMQRYAERWIQTAENKHAHARNTLARTVDEVIFCDNAWRVAWRKD